MKYVAGAALLPSGVVKGSTTSYDNRKLVALKANSPAVNSDLFPFGAPLWHEESGHASEETNMPIP